MKRQTIAQRRALARKCDREADELAARLKRAPVGTRNRLLAAMVVARTRALALGRAAR